MQLCRAHTDGGRAHADGGRVRAQAGFLSTTALSRAAFESAEATRARERARAARETKGVHERETETNGAHAKQRLPNPTSARDLKHGSSIRSPHDSSVDQLTHAKRALQSARSPASSPTVSAIDPLDPLAMCERALQSAFLSATALATAALESAEATRAKRDKAKSDERAHAKQPPPRPTPALEHGSSSRSPHGWNIDQLAHAKRALYHLS